MSDKNQKTYKEAAQDLYNQKYETWKPWAEDQYLKWFSSNDNKASYATKQQLEKSKITGNDQVDKLQDGVNNLVGGQVGKGGIAEPVGDYISEEGINRSERGGKDAEGAGPLGGSGDSAVEGLKGAGEGLSGGAKSAGGVVGGVLGGGKDEPKR